MAQPPLYSRQYSFSAFQTQNPSSPLPAQQVDIELNAVRASLNAAIGNIGLLQRDDGRLANNSVAMESIQPAVRLLLGAGWTPRGAWAPNTAYVVGNVVSEAGSTYVCNTAHVSLTTFAASSALWTTLFTVAPPPSTSYPEPLVADTGRFLVATAAGASAWQTLTVPLASSTTTGVLPLAKGGTGAADATAARAALSAASQAAVTTAQATADSALNVANNRVAKNGDTLTGFLTLHADPTSALHAATKQYVDATAVASTAKYISPEQAITLNADVTLAHSLGGRPSVLTAHLVCKTAELGYSVNDEVEMPLTELGPVSGLGITARANATQVLVRFSSVGVGIMSLANGSTTSITPTSWRLVVRAYRFV
jgi:hypothetical protein